MQLGQIEAHTALLWTVQVISGLGAMSFFLVLDRIVGRLGAFVGVFIGKLPFLPTQLGF